jgi:hypothetical protein
VLLTLLLTAAAEERGEEAEVAIGQVYLCMCGMVRPALADTTWRGR